MPTLEDVARLSVAALDADEDYLLAAQWAAERYRELASRVLFRHNRQLGQIDLPAPLSTGTVSITQGSLEVTPNGAALATWGPEVVGRWIRINNSYQWYEITAFGGGTVKLSTPFVETTVSGGTYSIVKRFHELHPDTRYIGDLIYLRRRWRLKPIDWASLNMVHPSRRQVGSSPWCWTEFGVGLNAEGKECKLVEIYPYVAQRDVVHFTWWPDPPLLDLESQLPKGVDVYVLREGVMVDLMRYKMAQATKAMQIEQAALWRNDYRAQQTVWEKKIQEAVKADRGNDDLTAHLLDAPFGMGEFDITDARSHVWGGR